MYRINITFLSCNLEFLEQVKKTFFTVFQKRLSFSVNNLVWKVSKHIIKLLMVVPLLNVDFNYCLII